MNKCLKGNYAFTPDNVFQTGNATNRNTIGNIAEKLMLPGSRLENPGALIELFRRCKEGQSCLLLAEHYSNFDYPVIYRMMERTPGIGDDSARRLLPIRGMKLSETVPFIATFARSYDAIVIYPSRSLDSITDPEKLNEVRKISTPINHAAMREMIAKKHQGRVILVFPAGTRYRPWDPASRKGVREIYSYLKIFDNIVFLAINGNLLIPSRTEDMTQDTPNEDLLILTCSNIVGGRQFLREVEEAKPRDLNIKQYVVDQVMEKLVMMHNRVEPLRIAEKQRLGIPATSSKS